MRAEAEKKGKQSPRLYGDSKSGKRSGSARKPSLNQNGRRSTNPSPAPSRPGSAAPSRGPSRPPSRATSRGMGTIREGGSMQGHPVVARGTSAPQGFRNGSSGREDGVTRRQSNAVLPRRSSFKPPAMDSDSDFDDSDSSCSIPPPAPLYPAQTNTSDAQLNSLGKKLRAFQERRNPSRFLDPNPDFYGRQKPYPVLFDPNLKKAYDTFCKRITRVRTVAQTQQDLQEVITRSVVKKETRNIWEVGYVPPTKHAWKVQGTANSWDSGPQFK